MHSPGVVLDQMFVRGGAKVAELDPPATVNDADGEGDFEESRHMLAAEPEPGSVTPRRRLGSSDRFCCPTRMIPIRRSEVPMREARLDCPEKSAVL